MYDATCVKLKLCIEFPICISASVFVLCGYHRDKSKLFCQQLRFRSSILYTNAKMGFQLFPQISQCLISTCIEQQYCITFPVPISSFSCTCLNDQLIKYYHSLDHHSGHQLIHSLIFGQPTALMFADLGMSLINSLYSVTDSSCFKTFPRMTVKRSKSETVS